MRGFRQLKCVFQLTASSLVVLGTYSFVNAQPAYNSTPVPQNQAQLQSQSQTSKSPQQKPGPLQRFFGAAFRGDDGPKPVPTAPANVNTGANSGVKAGVNAGMNTGVNTGPPPQTYQYPTGQSGLQVTPPRPTNVAYDSGASGNTVATPMRVPSQPATSTSSQILSGSASSQSGNVSGSSLHDRLKDMQKKKIFDDIDEPSSSVARESGGNRSSGLPSPPSAEQKPETKSTSKPASSLLGRSVKTESEDDAPQRSSSSRRSLSTDDSPLSGVDIDVPSDKPRRTSTTIESESAKPIAPRRVSSVLDNQDSDRSTGKSSVLKNASDDSGDEKSTASATKQSTPVPTIASQTKKTTEQAATPPKKSYLIKRQSPVLEIQTEGPERIVVNKESDYRFKVTNSSDISAESVVINIELPRWTENTQAPEVSGGSTTITPLNEEYSIFQWHVGKINPKEQEVLVLHVTPRERKSFDLKLTYDFKQSTSQAAIEVQQPNIEMTFEGPDEVLWGAEEKYQLLIKNTGNGDAQDIRLMLKASDAEQSTSKPISLKVGEKQLMDVFVTAKQSGFLQLNVQAAGPYGLTAEASKQVVVHRADLQLSVDAPGMQFVNNVVEYVVTVKNIGSAPAKNVAIEAGIPLGAKYLSNTGNGKIDDSQNQIVWEIDTIPVGGEHSCSVMCEAKREGDCQLEATVSAESGIHQLASAATRVEAIADVNLKIEKPQSPIPVGTDTEYLVVISNRGTKAAENIDVAALFADNLEPVSVEGGTARIKLDQRQREVAFERIPTLGAGQSLTYKIKARGQADGNHKIQAVMRCLSTGISLTKEETSYFYMARGKSPSPSQNFTDQPNNQAPLQMAGMGSMPAAHNGTAMATSTQAFNQTPPNQPHSQMPGQLQVAQPPSLAQSHQPLQPQAAQPQPMYAAQPPLMQIPATTTQAPNYNVPVQPLASNPMLNRDGVQQMPTATRNNSPELLSGAMQSNSASANSMGNASPEMASALRVPNTATNPIPANQTLRPLSQRASSEIMTLPTPPITNAATSAN